MLVIKYKLLTYCNTFESGSVRSILAKIKFKVTGTPYVFVSSMEILQRLMYCQKFQLIVNVIRMNNTVSEKY